MISIKVTVAEAIAIANTAGNDLHDRIVNAFEIALGVNQRRIVSITSGMNTDNRIPCIKAIRIATGWGLKESKEWTDKVVGYFDRSGHWQTPEAAELLLRDLTGLGCEGYLS